ncbi:hypothetical protein [Streptomyces candidus]|uniref:Uncharacterized protein n=1 Tax=Streptomyces candidus TaxID=67283 RepID=A0A7X0HPQ9_9ACTN|nr:hypothetical protein [Streptomyces candidus]MBB6440227.1 hypothetical protein [Streptomyces candidus]GHH50628.1 hypothetical protein GCM10018773_47900 [Streptomyces candidus]
MPPPPSPPGPARPAAVVNAEIRGLWSRSCGCLSPADEARYQELLVEWADAVRAELVEAA